MIGFYDESRNIFVSMSLDGRTVTSFIPKEGVKYVNSLDDVVPLNTKNINLIEGGYVSS